MQDINKKIVIFTVIAVILIGTISFLFIYRAKTLADEPLVGINGVGFTLNNIKENFLNSDYAKDNKCRVSVSEDGLNIKCKKNTYDYTFNGIELSSQSSEEESREVFKYLVNAIAELQGYDQDEYLSTVEEFINGNIAVTGLLYQKENGNIKYKINVVDHLPKYDAKEVIESESIKSLDDVSYEYSNLGYKISSLKIDKNDERHFIVFSAIVGGKDSYTADFTIKFYDDNNTLITSQTVDLNTIEKYNNPFIGLVVTTRFDDANMYNQVTKYSISLAE